MKGYMYILECADTSYYTGSTNDLEARVLQHQNGEGANYTKRRLPVRLVYYEIYGRIDEAFYREKQVQKWRRKKKEALINGEFKKLPALARNYTQYPRTPGPSTSSGTGPLTSVGGTGLRQAQPSVPEPADGPVPEPAEGPVLP